MSMEEHGLPRSFFVVAIMWIPYFILSHVDFVRLTLFALRLEEKELKRNQESQVSLFFASGIQSMVAVAAFIPTMVPHYHITTLCLLSFCRFTYGQDFAYFPGKIFSILTFPSLTFIAEVFFRLGKVPLIASLFFLMFMLNVIIFVDLSGPLPGELHRVFLGDSL